MASVKRGIVAGQQRVDVRLEPAEEMRVEDRAVLHHLGEAGAQFAVGQGAQHGGVGDHRARRMEGADQVLALRQVDRGLAADRGVDHRQQCRRQLHAVDAAHPAGRGEAGQIADHATAERDHGGIARRAQRGQRVQAFAEARQRLFLFARRHHPARRWRSDGLRRAQQRFGAIGIQRRDMAVADDQGMPAAQHLCQPTAVVVHPSSSRPRPIVIV